MCLPIEAWLQLDIHDRRDNKTSKMDTEAIQTIFVSKVMWNDIILSIDGAICSYEIKTFAYICSHTPNTFCCSYVYIIIFRVDICASFAHISHGCFIGTWAVTDRDRMSHICVSKTSHHWFRLYLNVSVKPFLEPKLTYCRFKHQKQT